MEAQQLALQIFSEMRSADLPITASNHEIGYKKANVLIDVADVGIVARRAINACYFIAAKNPGQTHYDVDREFFKWLMNFDSNNYSHLKKALREAQKSAVQINVVDMTDPADPKEAWASVPMLGTAVIANGRVVFKVPSELVPHLCDPQSFTYLSLRITAAFSSRYALTLYEKLSAVRYRGGTEWMLLSVFRDYIGAENVKTLEAFKDLNRYVLQPSVKQINELSDITVHYETKNETGSRKITHIRFLVAENPNGKFSLQNQRQETIRQFYDTLTTEFGLSDVELNEIATNREKWDDGRIEAAIEFTRKRISQAKNPIRYPGKFFMTALRDGLRLGTAETRPAAAAPAPPPLRIDRQPEPAAEGPDPLVEKVEALTAAQKKKLLAEFLASPEYQEHRRIFKRGSDPDSVEEILKRTRLRAVLRALWTRRAKQQR